METRSPAGLLHGTQPFLGKDLLPTSSGYSFSPSCWISSPRWACRSRQYTGLWPELCGQSIEALEALAALLIKSLCNSYMGTWQTHPVSQGLQGSADRLRGLWHLKHNPVHPSTAPTIHKNKKHIFPQRVAPEYSTKEKHFVLIRTDLKKWTLQAKTLGEKNKALAGCVC